MPVTVSAPAPYAPASAVLMLIRRHRERGLPMPVDADVLKRAGVSESLIPRTLIALVTLDLIDEKGSPTQTFEGLRLAPEIDYNQRLTQWLNDSYADVLGFVDPATATESELQDAFRSYKPSGQRTRMVTLFSGLYAAASIGPHRGNVHSVPRKSRATANVNDSGARTIRKPPTPEDTTSLGNGNVNPPLSSQDTTDKALEYKLIDLMRNEGIEDTHREAIWTLVRYLTAKQKVRMAESTMIDR